MGYIIIAISWGTIFTFLSEHWQWLLTVPGAFLLKYVKRAYIWVKDMNLMKAELPALHKKVDLGIQKVDKLLALFYPDEKSSIKDQMNRIEGRGIVNQQIILSMKENSPDGEFMTDVKGGWTWVNKTFIKMIAASKESDCLDNGWIAYLTHSSRDKAVGEYDKAVSQKRGTEFPCIFRVDYMNSVNVILCLEPIKNDDVIIGYSGTIKKSLNSQASE